MKFIGDFHIHSHFSISTSKDLKPEFLEFWARVKGIKVLGTGDFTHPGWVNELKEKLEGSGDGLFRLKETYRKKAAWQAEQTEVAEPSFILTAEISSIYKKHGQVRKVHNLIFAPDFEVVEKIQFELGKIGNITSDGRPILGLDSRDLLEIVLTCSDRVFFVPAHVWTPWFSVLGAKSGFDTIEECYDDLSSHIGAIEMGLSSNPPMNWLCSILDRFTLLANSDAHSPEKLGRNANLFDTEVSYDSIIGAMKSGNPATFQGTISFFPQEGKYHFDGHRKCGISWNPLETLEHKGLCPVCGKNVTVGVMNRVVQLSDRSDGLARPNRHPYYSLIPLKELLSEIRSIGAQSKLVQKDYQAIIQKMGPELAILLEVPVTEIRAAGYDLLAEAIERMRLGKVHIREGFDGEYGRIRVFQEEELTGLKMKNTSFIDMVSRPENPAQKKVQPFDFVHFRQLLDNAPPVETNCLPEQGAAPALKKNDVKADLNAEQKRAVEHSDGPALIIAGPGTGKTRTMTARIMHLIRDGNVSPEAILAVTFTNKAAREMRDRLASMVDAPAILEKLSILTFHAFGQSVLRRYPERAGRSQGFAILSDSDREYILTNLCGCPKQQVKTVLEGISRARNLLLDEQTIEEQGLTTFLNSYENVCRQENVFDLDDLIYQPVKLFEQHPVIVFHYRETFSRVMIDEYQDINRAQYVMIRKLLPDFNPNFFVIGDGNQAIYGFRGADVRFIGQFLDDFPQAEIFHLKQSYRCSNMIIHAAAEVIQSSDIGETSLQGLNEGLKVTLLRHSSDKSEAEHIARTIEHMIGGLRFFSMDSQITAGEETAVGTGLAGFAILCRLKEQIPVLAKALNDHKVPFQTVSERPFFQEEPLATISDFLKMHDNPECSVLKQKIESRLSSELKQCLQRISAASLNISEKIKLLTESLKLPDNPQVDYNLRRFLDFARSFENEQSFLTALTLGTAVDTLDFEAERVAVMTLHAAKGLEFDCVFIPGCEQGLIPYELFQKVRVDRDEERRLLYVGMTRARKYLFLSHADRRHLFGQEFRLEQSSFLDNLDNRFLDLQSVAKKPGRKNKPSHQLNLFDDMG